MNNIVLLVEDEEKTGSLLMKALSSQEIDTVWAKDGFSAIEQMEKGKFDLIILDLKLPKISGDEVLEKIRYVDPYVEVIVYTNYSTNSFDPSVMKRLFKFGVEEYVNKGADADLWGMVEKVKRRLDPFSDEERNLLISSLPEGSFKECLEGSDS